MKKILYVIDDINYNSGAKKVTMHQIKELKNVYDIYVFSLTKPKADIDFLDEKHILQNSIWASTEIYAEPFKSALKNKTHSFIKKISRIIYAISLRCGFGDIYFEKIICKNLYAMMEEFDDIIVVSEASKLRNMISKLKRPKKIQWIHTDYALWSEFSEWSKAIVKNDAIVYAGFDNIVTLSEHCKSGLIDKIPTLKDKIVVIPNLIDEKYILEHSREACQIEIDYNCLRLVTVARLDKEKSIDELLRLAEKMEQGNNTYMWYIIGDGPQKAELERRCEKLKLGEHVKLLGYIENPYPIMAACDSLVLLSKYEGTPVTIDEAMVLGLNIIARNVGGIAEQVKEYDSFCLIENDEFEKAVLKVVGKNKRYIDYEQDNKNKISLLESIL